MPTKTKMRAGLSLMLAASLVACSGEANPTQDDKVPATGSITDAPMPVEPDGGIGDGAAPLDETLENRIPIRFHGEWDHVEGNCSRESDMRMEISGSEILFYESIGIVTNVRADSEGGDIIVTLAMEGEGETWEESTRLSLTGEGEEERLETTQADAPKHVDEYPSKRCPS